MAGGTIAESLFKAADLPARTTNYAAQQFVLGLPPQQDVGYVTDHEYVVLYLWNGTADDAVLTSITGDDGAEGIVWDTGTPAVVAACDSLRIVVDVTIDGPLVIDGNLTFASSCAAILFHLTGTRAPHLSGDTGYLFMPHNWADGLDESLAWKTDVLIAFDRTEQRIQLRTHPRRTWDLQLLVSGAARRKLETWLGLRKTRRLFAPVWRDEGRLTAPVIAGESVLSIDDAQLYDYAASRWLAVYDAWDHFEIRTVTGIGAGFVAVDSPFNEDWPAGSLVAPCRYGVALEQRSVTRFTEDAASWRIVFEALNESLMPAMASPEIYRSIMVCPFVPSWSDAEETMANQWVRLDNGTGVIEYDIQSIEPVLARNGKFVVIGRENIDLFLRFLFHCAGRLAPFWLAADGRGFELAAGAAAGDTSIVIGSIAYEYALTGSQARSHVEMVTTGGTVIRRMITGVQTMPDGSEQLSLDGALPVDISAASLNRCAWLELCRLDSDGIDLKWWGGGCLEVTVPIVVLP